MLITSIIKAIKSLLTPKPTHTKRTRPNTKHGWVGSYIDLIKEPGRFLIPVPSGADARQVRSAVMARLSERFPGKKRVKTSIRTQRGFVEVIVIR